MLCRFLTTEWLRSEEHGLTKVYLLGQKDNFWTNLRAFQRPIEISLSNNENVSSRTFCILTSSEGNK